MLLAAATADIHLFIFLDFQKVNPPIKIIDHSSQQQQAWE